MQEKHQNILLISLEVISLAVLLPIFYWGTLKLVLAPIEDTYYTSHADPILPIWGVVMLILAIDAMWIVFMKLCPKDKIHIKVVLTLLFLTVSAAILSGFVVIEALSKAFA
jgi:multisubunit Na+/H+ antiporter MnhG subunit